MVSAYAVHALDGVLLARASELSAATRMADATQGRAYVVYAGAVVHWTKDIGAFDRFLAIQRLRKTSVPADKARRTSKTIRNDHEGPMPTETTAKTEMPAKTNGHVLRCSVDGCKEPPARVLPGGDAARDPALAAKCSKHRIQARDRAKKKSKAAEAAAARTAKHAPKRAGAKTTRTKLAANPSVAPYPGLVAAWKELRTRESIPLLRLLGDELAAALEAGRG